MFGSKRPQLDIEHIKKQEWMAIKSFITTNQSANQSERYGMALLKAAKANVEDRELYILLLTNKADITEHDRDNYTALHWAIKNKNVCMVEEFIRYTGQKKSFYNKFLLFAMESKSNIEIINSLLQAGATPLTSHPINNTCLEAASFHSDQKLFYTFLDHLKETKTKIPEDLLWIALESPTRNLELIQKLLEAGISPNSRSAKFHGTTLHFAVRNEDAELLKLLMRYLPDNTLRDMRLETPLALAARKEVWSCEVILRGYEHRGFAQLSDELKPEVKNDLFLLITLHAPMEDIVAFFQNKDAAPKDRKYLHLAFYAEYPHLQELIPLLLNKGCKPSQEDKKKITATMLAVNNKNWEAFKLFIHRDTFTGYEFYLAIRTGFPEEYVPREAPLSYRVPNDFTFRWESPFLTFAGEIWTTPMQWAAQRGMATLIEYPQALAIDTTVADKNLYYESLLKIAVKNNQWNFFFTLCRKINNFKLPDYIKATILEFCRQTINSYLDTPTKVLLERIKDFLDVTDKILPVFRKLSYDAKYLEFAKLLASAIAYKNSHYPSYLFSSQDDESWVLATIPYISEDSEVLFAVLDKAFRVNCTEGTLTQLLKLATPRILGHCIIWAACAGRAEAIPLIKPLAEEIPSALIEAATKGHWEFVKTLTHYKKDEGQLRALMDATNYKHLANLAIEAGEWDYLLDIIEHHKNANIFLPKKVLNKALDQACKKEANVDIMDKLVGLGAERRKHILSALTVFAAPKGLSANFDPSVNSPL